MCIRDRASAVHLVHGNNELTHTERERKQSVLTRLTVLRDTSLELTGTTSDDEDGAVSLRGTRNHVLNEVTVTRGVDDRDVVLGGLEAPQGLSLIHISEPTRLYPKSRIPSSA